MNEFDVIKIIDPSLNTEHLKTTQENPTVSVLVRRVTPFRDSTQCSEIIEVFYKDKSLFTIPIVDVDNKPIGIIDRNRFLEGFVRPFARELFGKKSISSFLSLNPIVVDINTTVDDVSRIIIGAGMQHMVSGFIVTQEGYYIGMADGHDLLNEITSRKQASLYYLAHYDQLTKLPNRLLFMDRLGMAIKEAKRKSKCFGLLFLDLDRFKHFNDSMGHTFGDALLTAFADLLLMTVRESDTVARLSGDEFVILVDDLTMPNHDLERLIESILDKLKIPLNVKEKLISISTSIGGAVYPDDGVDCHELLVKADAAMYESKRHGRNTYTKYMDGMDIYSLDKLSLKSELRVAIERNQFEMYYQPQVSLVSNKLIGAEALIRWNHPDRGILTPIHFLELAEDSGLIVSIGNWVVETVCQQYVSWIEQGFDPGQLAINISALQFYQPNFFDILISIISKTNMPPSSLELELTESMFMQDIDGVIRTLNNLHDIGVSLAIDDFGTGYSNLSYLKKFSVDKLKIDQSFVRGIQEDPVNMEIVRAVSAISKSMGMELIAEGVETVDELNILKSIGCEYVQGYFFSRPLCSADFKEYASKLQSKSLLSHPSSSELVSI